jgi:hypothetical protein
LRHARVPARFLDPGWDEAGFDASTFAKNTERLLQADVARRLFDGIVWTAKAARLLSAEHFTVDGTLIAAWASLKSFRPREEDPVDRPPPDDAGNPTVNFHAEKRSNAAHVAMENRHGLCAAVSVADANPATERTEAVRLLETLRRRGFRPTTVGGNKASDTAQFVANVRALLRIAKLLPELAPT